MFPRQIDGILEALRVVGFTTEFAVEAVSDAVLRHCVRCHRNYNERHNGLSACVVHHDEARLMKSNDISKTPEYTHYFACCKQTKPTSYVVPSPHFVGRHTTTASNVLFNSTNVVPCEVKKCVVPNPQLSMATQIAPAKQADGRTRE